MSNYDEKPEDLIQDTKEFLKSEYGKHIMTTLKDMQEGLLSSMANINEPYTDRYAAKFSAMKEVIELVESPLDDDTPSHG